jgi:hypothetical protein
MGRDKVIAIPKPGEEGLEHPRGRGESVQQEKRRHVFGTCGIGMFVQKTGKSSAAGEGTH